MEEILADAFDITPAAPLITFGGSKVEIGDVEKYELALHHLVRASIAISITEKNL